MARLSHPNVIRVYDVGEAFGSVFVAMEFVDGGTLRDWLEAAPRTQREILDAFAQAGRGLAAAHDAGLVHRDFKPSNVLVGKDGRVLVTHFGIARPIADAEPVGGSAEGNDRPAALGTVTRTGGVAGTPEYMAPSSSRARSSALAPISQLLHGAVASALPVVTVHGQDQAGAVGSQGAGPAVDPSHQPPSCGPHPRGARAWFAGGKIPARFPSLHELLAALAHDPRQRRRASSATGSLSSACSCRSSP